MLADTVRRLDDTGLRVLGAEAIRLDGTRGGWEPVLAAAAELGARYLNAISEDGDLTRLADRFAELTQLALPYRVRPVIEFMSYKPVHTLRAALDIAALSAGGRVLVDSLHVQRCGVSLAELAAADPALLSYVQLCDAPGEPPTGLAPPAHCPAASRPPAVTWPWRRAPGGCCRARVSCRWLSCSACCPAPCRSAWKPRPGS